MSTQTLHPSTNGASVDGDTFSREPLLNPEERQPFEVLCDEQIGQQRSCCQTPGNKLLRGRRGTQLSVAILVAIDGAVLHFGDDEASEVARALSLVHRALFQVLSLATLERLLATAGRLLSPALLQAQPPAQQFFPPCWWFEFPSRAIHVHAHIFVCRLFLVNAFFLHRFHGERDAFQ